jgi:hypothetical protein
MGDLVEVIGNINDGDEVALKATDELKTGTHLIVKRADKEEIAKAGQHASAGGE